MTEKQYKKKLGLTIKSFQNRAPIYFSFTITNSNLIIENIRNGEVLVFKLDYSIPIDEFVSSIHLTLKKNEYPKIKKVTTFEGVISLEDLTEYMKESGKDLDSAYSHFLHKTVTEEIVIDKVNMKKNQIITENENGDQTVFTLKMPIVVFLKMLSNGEISSSEAYYLLSQESRSSYQIKRKEK